MTANSPYISDFMINSNQMEMVYLEILLKLLLVMVFCMVVFGWPGKEMPA